MVQLKIAATSAVFCAVATFAFAQIGAVGTISVLSHVGSEYTYNLDLTNTGTTNIATLWFAWIPGQSYLPSIPTSFGSPTGWAEDLISHESGTQGYGVRWDGGPLAAGKSANGFTFTTVDAPSVVLGNAPFDNNPPTSTSTVYQNGPFEGQSKIFAFTPTPEPSGLFALGGSLLALGFRRRKR